MSTNMKASQKVAILEEEVENLRELAGETLATCLLNLNRKKLWTADDREFRKYLTLRLAYLKKINKRLRAAS